jgi:hypothetical protein
MPLAESSNSGREPIVDQAGTAFMLVEQPREPGTFDEAFNHPGENVRLKWREAIHKEFKEMHFEESGRKSTKKRCLLDVDVSRVNGCLRSNKTESFEIDWLPVDTAKYLGSILTTVSLQL